jgi:mRNA-degrading endonuclease toxin of MazEF toxin-antitoxin module
VIVGTEAGLKAPSAINLHNLVTVPAAGLRSYVGTVDALVLQKVRDALLFALGFGGRGA